MKMEQIECSETSANNNQTPGKYPKEYIQHQTTFRSLQVKFKMSLCFIVQYAVSMYREMKVKIH